MKSNEDLQNVIQHAIKWHPMLDPAGIGVTVLNGIVTLTGTVDNYDKKEETEKVVKNVAGVTGIVNHIKVHINDPAHPTDEEIAKAIIEAFKWRWDIPNRHLRVKVENGSVTLDGEVTSNHQKEAARKTVSRMVGVKGIFNNICIMPDQDKADSKDIQSALWRDANINDDDIHVEVIGSKVILTGYVPSFSQKAEAEKVAWSAPGITAVENQLQIGGEVDLL